jgi:hypothetical protein
VSAELVSEAHCALGGWVPAAKQETEPTNIEKHFDDPFPRYADFLVRRGSRRRRSSMLSAKW